MSSRVERIAPGARVALDGAPAAPEECPWCGDALDGSGACSRNCEGSRRRVDRFDTPTLSGGQLDVCPHGVVRARCLDGCTK